jgi:hypothetical protein
VSTSRFPTTLPAPIATAIARARILVARIARTGAAVDGARDGWQTPPQRPAPSMGQAAFARDADEEPGVLVIPIDDYRTFAIRVFKREIEFSLMRYDANGGSGSGVVFRLPAS